MTDVGGKFWKPVTVGVLHNRVVYQTVSVNQHVAKVYGCGALPDLEEQRQLLFSQPWKSLENLPRVYFVIPLL